MRAVVKSVLLLAAAALLSLASYDIAYFKPQKHKALLVVEQARAEGVVIPQHVSELLKISLRQDPSIYAARLLLADVRPNNNPHWHSTFFLWSVLVRLHLSETEQIFVVASLAPTGNGLKGLAAAAQAIYSRPMSELSVSEAATLVCLTQSPLAINNQARLAKLRDSLLSKYETRT